MDSDSSSPWNNTPLSSYNSTVTSSKSYLSALQSRSDMFMGGGFDENDIVVDDDDDVKEEFLCPFCSDYFDIVGLCCHIDEEHPVEAKNGVCPVCALRVGVDMVAHIALQHGSILKIQRKRKSRKGGSYSTLSLLRKELRDGNLQSLLGGSSCIMSSSNAAPDPLLSSFILPVADEYSSSQSQPNFLTGTRQSRKSSDETLSKKYVYFICQLPSVYLFIFKKSRLPLHGNMLIFASIPDCGGDVDVTSLDPLLPSFSLLQ
ncbi:Drought-responsive family protein [Trifolium repens]|nr:Drought-responsive family protein [Trifolium repens]